MKDRREIVRKFFFGLMMDSKDKKTCYLEGKGEEKYKIRTRTDLSVSYLVTKISPIFSVIVVLKKFLTFVKYSMVFQSIFPQGRQAQKRKQQELSQWCSVNV